MYYPLWFQTYKYGVGVLPACVHGVLKIWLQPWIGCSTFDKMLSLGECFGGVISALVHYRRKV